MTKQQLIEQIEQWSGGSDIPLRDVLKNIVAELPDAHAPSPIPTGVYYSAEHNNFYDRETRKGKGVAFYAEWLHRCDEFPTLPDAPAPAQAAPEAKTAGQTIAGSVLRPSPFCDSLSVEYDDGRLYLFRHSQTDVEFIRRVEACRGHLARKVDSAIDAARRDERERCQMALSKAYMHHAVEIVRHLPD